MNGNEVIILGSGAAGLFCARELANAGKKVIVLEARSRHGGRIHTITDNQFPLPVELGAEFIHGDLPVTKKVLKEAGIDFYKIKGDIWRSELGEFAEQEDFIEEIDLVIKQLKKLPTDVSIADFLDHYFSGEKFAKLRKTLKSYVEGYDAADTQDASAFALLQELVGEDDNQYRIKGGYIKLVEYLVKQCSEAGCIFKLETIIKEIRWRKDFVEAVDDEGNHFSAKKIVITVPLGVLQSPANSRGHITFTPAIPGVQQAIDTIGYGAVIKIILHFDEAFWNDAKNKNKQSKKSEPGFVFSDAIIPTWWTQLPEKNGMISGWLGGPKASRLADEPEEKILNLALESLAVIFQILRTTLQSKLVGYYIWNWGKDEFSRGAYSYEKVQSKNAKATIVSPLDNTIYFAGEAYHDGGSGTVEAALISGKKTAEKILKMPPR